MGSVLARPQPESGRGLPLYPLMSLRPLPDSDRGGSKRSLRVVGFGVRMTMRRNIRARFFWAIARRVD